MAGKKTISLATIKPNPDNPRQITEAQFAKLKESIARDQKFMPLRPIITDADGVILGGNMRYRACVALGLKDVPASWVRRADDLTEDEKKRFVVLDNLQAAFLDVKLRHLPDWIIRRKKLANRYREAFLDIPDLLLPHYSKPGFDHVYQNYTVRTKQGNDFSEYLKKNGVEVLTQFRKPYYKHKGLKLLDRGFPETEALSREVCSLPMNVETTDDEVDYVIKTVRSFYDK